MTWKGAGVRGDRTRALGGRDLAGDRIPRGDRRWTDMMAGAAEDLVCFVLGVENERRTKGPDRGWDIRLPGLLIDVKWTDKDDGMLLCAMASRSRADVYVLVTGTDPDDLHIRGWATAEELHASIKDLGHGPVYALEQWQLHDTWPPHR